MYIMTYNILASCYADPKYYPRHCVEYLDINLRRKAICNFLSMNKNLDIIAFQEITDDTNDKIGEFTFIKNFLSEDYICHIVHHDSTYWSSYFNPDSSANNCYMKNGNALFIRKNLFSIIKWHDISSNTGNHAICLETEINNSKFRIVNVHFDNLNVLNRQAEFKNVMDYLYSNDIGCIQTQTQTQTQTFDIILGDFNDDVHANSVMKNLMSIYKLHGTKTDKLKHTYASTDICQVNHPIDHILISENLIDKIVESNVYDNNFLNIQDKNERINKTLQFFGTDHYPVYAKFTFESDVVSIPSFISLKGGGYNEP